MIRYEKIIYKYAICRPYLYDKTNQGSKLLQFGNTTLTILLNRLMSLWFGSKERKRLSDNQIQRCLHLNTLQIIFLEKKIKPITRLNQTFSSKELVKSYELPIIEK